MSTFYHQMVSGYRREVAENCALLFCYAASTGKFLLTFRDNLSVPSSGFKDLKIGSPETSVINYRHSFRNKPEGRISLFTNIVEIIAHFSEFPSQKEKEIPKCHYVLKISPDVIRV